MTCWNTQARPTSPPAAGLRDPRPRDRARAREPPVSTTTGQAWPGRPEETPRARPSPPARAPRPGPRRRNLRDSQSRTPQSDPQPQLLAQPSTHLQRCPPPPSPHSRAAPTPPLARARVPDPRMARRLLPAPNGRGRSLRGRGPVGEGLGAGPVAGRQERKPPAALRHGRASRRSGASEDEPLAQWTQGET